MMKKLTSILFLMVAICAMAQTNIFVVYSFLDGSGNPETVRQISFTPLTVNALGNSIITSNTITRVVTGTNYTNSMISGIAYEVKYYAAAYPPVPIADFTNYFPTTIPANSVVNASAYMSFGFAWGTSTTGSGGGSTNLFNSDFTTNAGLIAVSPTSPTVTAIATNLFGFGATGLFGVLEAPALYFGGLVSGGAMLNGFIGLNGKLYDTNGVKFYDSANNTFSGTLNGNATSITGTIPASQVTGGVVTTNQLFGNYLSASLFQLTPLLYTNTPVTFVQTNYVSTNGNDATAINNDITHPWRTLDNASSNYNYQFFQPSTITNVLFSVGPGVWTNANSFDCPGCGIKGQGTNSTFLYWQGVSNNPISYVSLMLETNSVFTDFTIYGATGSTNAGYCFQSLYNTAPNFMVSNVCAHGNWDNIFFSNASYGNFWNCVFTSHYDSMVWAAGSICDMINPVFICTQNGTTQVRVWAIEGGGAGTLNVYGGTVSVTTTNPATQNIPSASATLIGTAIQATGTNITWPGNSFNSGYWLEQINGSGWQIQTGTPKTNFVNNIVASGTFTGNGGGLTNLNAGSLIGGPVTNAINTSGAITTTGGFVNSGFSTTAGTGIINDQYYALLGTAGYNVNCGLYFGVAYGTGFYAPSVGNIICKTNLLALGSITATNGFVSYATNRTLVPVVATGITNTLGVTGYLPITAATGLVRYDCQSNVVSTTTTVTSQYDVILQPGGWATWTTVTTNGQFHAW